VSRSELLKICKFVTGPYNEPGPPDPAMIRASQMLRRMMTNPAAKEFPRCLTITTSRAGPDTQRAGGRNFASGQEAQTAA
jgi:hypothetical protein